MKKLICLVLVMSILFSFCSCAEQDGTKNAKENKFESVTITLDNYKDYFELRDHFYAYKDQFGDYIDSMTYGVYLCLKDEYVADTGFDKSDVSVKFEKTMAWYGFDFNEKTGEGKRLEIINEYNDVYTVTEGFSDYSKDEGFEKLGYAARIDGQSVATWPYDEGGFGEKYKYSVDYPEKINITGIMGTLYVRKK